MRVKFIGYLTTSIVCLLAIYRAAEKWPKREITTFLIYTMGQLATTSSEMLFIKLRFWSADCCHDRNSKWMENVRVPLRNFCSFFPPFFPQIENQLGSFPQTAEIYGKKTKPSTLKLEDRAAAATAQHKQPGTAKVWNLHQRKFHFYFTLFCTKVRHCKLVRVRSVVNSGCHLILKSI